jgi:hypothetical protein
MNFSRLKNCLIARLIFRFLPSVLSLPIFPGGAWQSGAAVGVLFESFRALYQIVQPGSMVDLLFRWRRGNYAEYQPPLSAELV